MSDLERPPHGQEPGEGAHENEVRKLLQMAGPLPDVPEDDLASITAAARATWRQQVARAQDTGYQEAEPEETPFSRRSRWPLALAAAIVAAMGAALWWGGLGVVDETNPATIVAEAQRVWGTASIDGPDRAGTERVAITEGLALTAGSRIATTGPDTANRVALLLEGGTSLRLDHGTRVRLISATELELEAGAIYLDTGLEDRPAVTVHTPYGTVTDIGTQFSVRLPQGSQHEGPLQVRVREGEVHVAGATDSVLEVLAGTELLLTADGAENRRQIPAYGSEWDWILEAAPRFEVEGMSLSDYLSWVTRETGWAVRIDDPALAAAAEATVLHGTTGSLRPDRAALAVLAGAGFHGDLEEGTLVLRRKAH